MPRGEITPGRSRALWVLLVGQLLVNVDLAVVNIAAPTIRQELSATSGEVALTISGYILSYAVLLITGARLGATYGYRRVFILGLAGFGGTSLLCGVAPNVAVLILARIGQGAAAAVLVPQVLSCIQLYFRGRARRRAIGYYGVALSGGAVAGQMLGGLLVSADLFGTSWRPIFLINVPLGIALLIGALRYLPQDTAGGQRRFDFGGVAGLSAALLLAIVPLELGKDLGWPLWVWPCMLASLPVFVGFVLLQSRAARGAGNPLLNIKLIAQAPIRWGLVAHGATTLTYLSLLFVLAQYLQEGLGKTPAFSGFAMVSWVAAFGIAGPLLPRLPERLSAAAPLIGCSILAGAYVAISLITVAGAAGDATLLSVLGVGGFGLGLSSASLITHLTAATPERYAADISGVISTNAQLWGAVGVAAGGTAYVDLVAGAGATPHRTAFALVTAGFSVVALGAALAAYRATRSPEQRNAQPEADVELGLESRS